MFALVGLSSLVLWATVWGQQYYHIADPYPEHRGDGVSSKSHIYQHCPDASLELFYCFSIIGNSIIAIALSLTQCRISPATELVGMLEAFCCASLPALPLSAAAAAAAAAAVAVSAVSVSSLLLLRLIPPLAPVAVASTAAHQSAPLQLL